MPSLYQYGFVLAGFQIPIHFVVGTCRARGLTVRSPSVGVPPMVTYGFNRTGTGACPYQNTKPCSRRSPDRARGLTARSPLEEVNPHGYLRF